MSFGRFSGNRLISYAKNDLDTYGFFSITPLFSIKIYSIIPHSIEKTFLYTLVYFRIEKNIDKTLKPHPYLEHHGFYGKPRFFSLDKVETQLKIYHSIEKTKLNRMMYFIFKNVRKKGL
jgi:hypothetical protein